MQETFELIDVDELELHGAPSPFVRGFVTPGVLGMPVTQHSLHSGGLKRLAGGTDVRAGC